eukprot:tig00000093_g3522.t1
MFNAGNHRGCSQEYQATALALLQSGNVAGDVGRTLAAALARAAQQGDTEAAWTMRRAFDSIIASTFDTAQQPRPVNVAEASRPRSGSEPSYPINAMTMGLCRWNIVNDTVMGGRSSSTARVTGAGELEWTGNVTKAGGGGFASVRGAPPGPLNWGGAEGVDMKVAGDGQRYKIQLRTDAGFDGVAYQADFMTEAEGTWQNIRVPFSKFVPTFRGRPVESAPPLSGADVRSVGFMLSFLTHSGAPNPDFVPGPFSLRVRSVTPYAPGRSRPTSLTELGA